MALVVIDGKVCMEVTKEFPNAFYHCGSWYVYFKNGYAKYF